MAYDCHTVSVTERAAMWYARAPSQSQHSVHTEAPLIAVALPTSLDCAASAAPEGDADYENADHCRMLLCGHYPIAACHAQLYNPTVSLL